jgi:putative endonuclease
MGTHLKTGKYGEQLACRYLEKRDFSILFCNWRSGHHEIDVIASKDSTIHFIEVKTRNSLEFGYPEESVTKRKFRCLKNAAEAYLLKQSNVKNIQFDIISILILPGKPPEYFLLEDVYMD